MGHPWLPRPSARLLDFTYRCTCTCYHPWGPESLESTQGGEEPDRFRAPRGVLQVLQSLKKTTKHTATCAKWKQCNPVPPCSSQKQQGMALVVFSGYVQPSVCCCSGCQPPAEFTGSTLFTGSAWPLPLTHSYCVWCWWEPVGGLDTLHGFEKPLQREGCPHHCPGAAACLFPELSALTTESVGAGAGSGAGVGTGAGAAVGAGAGAGAAGSG